VVQEVGLLDTRFGLGLFEDDDYCLRIRMAGFRLLWARDVYIHHEGHQTFRSFTEEAYQRRMRENERLFREKWDLGRYFGTGGDGTPGVASAWDMLRAGRYPEAYDGFERMVQANPGDVRALLGLGLAAEGRGSPPAAELAYRTALALAPDDPDASRCLTRVRSRNGSR
jgi:tetratricopeptide (TPR) repeat protein